MVAKSPESQTTVCCEERAVSVCCFADGVKGWDDSAVIAIVNGIGGTYGAGGLELIERGSHDC